MDITEHVKAKSDQLNASDLIGGPITVQVQGVERGNRDQPVIVTLSNGHMPWKPSKTALRALSYFWGNDTKQWEGQWVQLYRDPRTLWAGKPVGGIMVQGLSNIKKSETLTLQYSRGKTNAHPVAKLNAPQQKDTGKPTANLFAFLDENGLTMAAVDAWCVTIDKPIASTMDEAGQAKVAAYLAGNQSAVDAVRQGGE